MICIRDGPDVQGLSVILERTMNRHSRVLLFFWLSLLCARGEELKRHLVCVSNERSGTVSVFREPGGDLLKEIAVGKRPRGIHASPDGRFLYVAVSGSPITGPPKLDAKGNPIPEKENDDDDADHTADGIAVIDMEKMSFLHKLPAGSDPEEFAVTPDGTHLYISNEDVGTVSLLNISSEKVDAIIPVKREPEGVAIAPDGKRVFVTCEAGGEVFVIDDGTRKITGQFTVGGRPRTVAFLPDGTRAFVPSESAGKLSLVDLAALKVLRTVTLPAGSRPMGTAIMPDGRKLYVSTGRGGSVLVIDPTTTEVLTQIKVGPRPWGIALAGGLKRAYVANGPSNDISIIDTETDRELQRLKAGEGPWGVTVVGAPATTNKLVGALAK